MKTVTIVILMMILTSPAFSQKMYIHTNHQAAAADSFTLAQIDSITFSLTPASLNDSLVAYYPFNENAYDSSGHNLNGTTNSGISWSNDRHGNANAAIHFDGSTGVVDVADNNLLELTQSFSIGVWLKSSVNPSNITEVIVGKHKNGTPNDGSWLLVVQHGTMQLENWPGSSQVLYANDTTHVQSGIWYFVCLTFDKSTNSWVFYVNGQASTSGTTPFVIKNTSFALRFGNEQNQSGNYLSGDLDDVRIYSRALSDSEVQALYRW